jgi:hypothetical protein
VSGFLQVHKRFSRCCSWTQRNTDLFGKKKMDIEFYRIPYCKGADIVDQIFHEHCFEIIMGTRSSSSLMLSRTQDISKSCWQQMIDVQSILRPQKHLRFLWEPVEKRNPIAFATDLSFVGLITSLTERPQLADRWSLSLHFLLTSFYYFCGYCFEIDWTRDFLGSFFMRDVIQF